MEAFRVICETCGSRLKIRSPEIIGEIHACPKCSSMVHIVPPAGWTAGVATAAAALAGTPAEAALTISPSASTIVPAEFAFDLPVASTVAAPTTAPAVDPITSLASPPIPATSPILWWGLGSAAVFTLVGLTYALWPSGDKQVATPLPAMATTPPAAPTVDHQASNTPDPYTVDHSTDAPVDPTATKPIEPVTAASAPVTQPDTPKVADSPAPTLPVAPHDPPPPGEPASAGGSAARTAQSTAANPTERPDAVPSTSNAGGSEHVLKFDPLDFDPEHLSLSSKPSTGATTSPPVPSTSSIPPEPPGEAAPGEAASAAGNSGEPKPPAASDLLPPPAANQAVNVRRGPTAGDESRPLDTAQHLATRLKSFQVTEMPLVRFVETLSEMAGAPITLDPITLELNGLSPRTVVSVDATDATLEKILQDAFTAQRLELVEQDGRIGVALANADEQRAVDFDVKDLAKGTDAAPIAKLLERFVAPESWQANGGKGTIKVNGTTLHIDHSLTVRREALIFCERLRAARGLALRSKYPPALLTVDSPYEKAAATLNQPTTFTFLGWTRLADVVRQWQDMSDLTILVDWSALRDADLGPSSPMACSTIDRPWTEALDGVLNPLGLGWWATDGQTIQITSLDALERIERVEFYAIPKKLREQYPAADALITSLQKEISEHGGKHDKPDDGRMELDEPSGRLIVRATPDVQRLLTGHLSSATK